jgi:hypothetical protein
MKTQATRINHRVPTLALLSFVVCAAALYAHPANATSARAADSSEQAHRALASVS